MADELQPLLSQSAEEDTSLWAVLSGMLRKFELTSESILPAKVISFDRDKNIATVQPMIMVVTVTGKTISRQELEEVPTLSLGGGSFHISFPLNAGDLGWIYACDRDMTLFKQSLEESAPNGKRTKCFSQSMFIPDVFRKYTINPEDEGALVIQSVDSQTRISVRSDNIKITAPTKVLIDTPETEITGNLTVDKNCRIKGTEQVDGIATFKANTVTEGGATVAQGLAANGGFTAAGGHACTLPSEATIGGVQVINHGHQVVALNTRTGGGMVN